MRKEIAAITEELRPYYHIICSWNLLNVIDSHKYPEASVKVEREKSSLSNYLKNTVKETAHLIFVGYVHAEY